MSQLTSVSVRMYYTGFGDCFLLTFWYEEPTTPATKKGKTLWIDFGARAEKSVRMQEIARHLKAHLTDQGLTRNGKPFVDVLAITHEHQDHISGLKQARDELAGIDIGQVWFAWTEDPKDEMAKAWRTHKKQTRESLQKAVQQVRQEVSQLTEQVSLHSAELASATDKSHKAEIKARLEATDHTAKMAAGLADRLNLMAGFEFAATETAEDADNPSLDFSVNENYDRLIEKVGKDNVRYLRPGYTEPSQTVVPGHIIGEGLTSVPSPTIFPGLKLFVLGPPRNLTVMRASEPEDWQSSLRADTTTNEFNFGQSNFADALDSADKDFWYYVQKAPFDEEFVMPIDLKTQKLPPSAALNIQENQTAVSRQVQKNFDILTQTKAFQTYFDPIQTWRQINADYLSTADALAIQLNTGVNNTSLVLAIEIDETNEVLFFSGDAEFGVWDDWESDQKKPAKQRQYTWTLPTNPARAVTVEDLMSRTIFYKMGHHGSQNATPNTRGITKLSSPHLHTLIPVDEAKAKKFRWDRIPFKDLLTVLDNRQVPYIRADQSRMNLDVARSRQKPLPSGSTVDWAVDDTGNIYVDWMLTLPSATP